MVRRAWPLLVVLGCSSEGLAPGGADPGGSEPAAPTSTAPSAFGDAPFEQVKAYPPGPYGRGLGAVIENLSFLGWRDPVRSGYDPAVLETVSLADFYDPSGTRTKLIVLNASAVWCSVCRSEMQDMRFRDTYNVYRDKGVEIVGTLFEDVEGGPARPADLQLWGSSSAHEIAFPLLLDPAFKASVYFTSDATPLNMIIDATTMRIVFTMMGYDGGPSGFWTTVDRALAERGAPLPP